MLSVICYNTTKGKYASPTNLRTINTRKVKDMMRKNSSSIHISAIFNLKLHRSIM